MVNLLIPVDLVYVPAQGPALDVDDGLSHSDYCPITACINSSPSLWKRLYPLYQQRVTVCDYDRDRLLVRGDLEPLALAKASGRKWIYARADEEIANKWRARDESSLREIVAASGRAAFYKPVYLESFRGAKISRPKPIRLDRFRRLLGSIGPDLTGLDIGCNIAFMTHHMERHGISMTGIEYDNRHLEVARCLTQSYGLKTRVLETSFADFTPGKAFDFVFALTVLYHIFFRQKEVDAKDAARKVGDLTGSVLFWESGDQPDREKELLFTYGGFDCYRTLGPTKATGLDRELGFFCKSSTDVSKALLRRYERVGLRWIMG